ncbi:hypothetical protein HMPREF9005_0886 [Actinomyces sp. oral taxon 178 str. F0338]|nr:hypothetical protein HMPREF9005_0886 [Actinomyces sp. oral taxon 178 str. F0338]
MCSEFSHGPSLGVGAPAPRIVRPGPLGRGATHGRAGRGRSRAGSGPGAPENPVPRQLRRSEEPRAGSGPGAPTGAGAHTSRRSRAAAAA